MVAGAGRQAPAVDADGWRPDLADDLTSPAAAHAEVAEADLYGTSRTEAAVDRSAVRGSRPLASVARRTLAVVAAGAVAVTFAPWLRTGTATRTSHEVVRAADRLAVLSSGSQAVVSVAWSFLPLVAALAVLALVLDRSLLAACLAATVGLVEVLLALAINDAPRSAEWGTPAGLALGSALVAVAVATAWTTRSSR